MIPTVVQLAKLMQHPDADYTADLPKDLVDALMSEINPDAFVDDFRADMLEHIETWAIVLAPRTQEPLATAPAELRPLLARINLGLIERLLVDMEKRGVPFQDRSFMHDLINGFWQVDSI